MATKEKLKVPKNTIEYDGQRRVVKVTRYCNVNNKTVSEYSIERKGTRFYSDVFDEHHAFYVDHQLVRKKSLSPLDQAIFNAGTMENVAQLRSGLATYVDKCN